MASRAHICRSQSPSRQLNYLAPVQPIPECPSDSFGTPLHSFKTQWPRAYREPFCLLLSPDTKTQKNKQICTLHEKGLP